MTDEISNAELEAYLDEALPEQRMVQIEAALREHPQLCDRLASSLGRRDAGLHSLGAIWRRHRLSCPSREQLGSYLLNVLEPGQADYLKFHLEEIGCRYCNANLIDLQQQHAASDQADVESRRGEFFRTSAGYLSRGK